MNKIELVQKIGDQVCEECGPDADCGIDPNECFRIIDAVGILDKYLTESAPQPANQPDRISGRLFKRYL